MIHAPEKIDKHVEELQRLYIEQCRKYSPTFALLERHSPTSEWRSLAQVLLDTKVQPRHFIQSVLSQQKHGQLPSIKILNQSAMRTIEKAKEHTLRDTEEVERAMSFMLNLYHASIKIRPIARVLTDQGIDLNPLFRYAYAWQNGYFQIAAMYEQDALNLLRAFPMYVNYLDLPKELVESI